MWKLINFYIFLSIRFLLNFKYQSTNCVKMKRILIILGLASGIISCAKENKYNSNKDPDSTKIATKLVDDHLRTVEVICDSVYPKKNYKITLKIINNYISDWLPRNNAVFILEELTNNHSIEIYKDSIYTRMSEIKFEDFNNDKIKDILVQNFSDVRSNLTYNLYLVDTTDNRLKKIKGFETIKNPEYLPKHNLIFNYVLSGSCWTSFYQIRLDSIFDYNIVIYDNNQENPSYERDFERAIKKIKKL